MKHFSFLLVDENKSGLNELESLVKEAGYQIIQTASNANNAWTMLRVKSFDCVIAAYEMSDMSGLALLRVVRSEDRFNNLPFFLTDPAFTRVKVIQAGQAGVTGLIVSPFSLANLKSKIKAVSDEPADEAIAEKVKTLDDGLKLIEKQDYRNALTVFEKLTQQGESAEYYYNIGYIKTAQGQYPEAIAAFRKATQLDRLFAKAFEAMGRAYQQLGRPQDAEKCLQKAADIYMSKERTDDAEAILNEILESGTESINVFNSLGVLYRKKGEYKTALKYYQKALKIHPREQNIHYNMGRLFLEMRDPKNARICFMRALKLNPEFKEAKEILNAIELGSF